MASRRDLGDLKVTGRIPWVWHVVCWLLSPWWTVAGWLAFVECSSAPKHSLSGWSSEVSWLVIANRVVSWPLTSQHLDLPVTACTATVYLFIYLLVYIC